MRTKALPKAALRANEAAKLEIRRLRERVKELEQETALPCAEKEAHSVYDDLVACFGDNPVERLGAKLWAARVGIPANWTQRDVFEALARGLSEY